MSGKVKLKAPLENVVWMDPDELNANDYNPNVVMTKEMELLKLSLERNGWIQPVLIGPDKTIIDGFHRSTISRLNGWMVPTVTLDIDRRERMLLTVRINRAKGCHVAVKMSELVQTLLDEGCSEEYLCQSIGATPEEVQILKKGDLFRAIDLSKWTYSKAWLPKAYERH